MMQVMNIRPTEQVSVDQERLGALYSQLGEAGAEDVVCRAMEELALRMSSCDRLYWAQDWVGLRKGTHSLTAIDEQNGLQALGRVAADVSACIDSTLK